MKPCLNCRERPDPDDAGQWLRLRYLCGRCLSEGFRLELFTNSPFPPRRWFVHVTQGGEIVDPATGVRFPWK